MLISKINTDELEPEVFDSDFKSKKANSIKGILNKSKNIKVEESDIDMFYLIFSLGKVCEDYNIAYEDCVILLYLYELGVFPLSLEVHSKMIRLKGYLLIDLIKEEGVFNGKKLYSLTNTSNDILKKIFSFDYTRVKHKNRVVETGVGLKVSSALNSYFE